VFGLMNGILIVEITLMNALLLQLKIVVKNGTNVVVQLGKALHVVHQEPHVSLLMTGIHNVYPIPLLTLLLDVVMNMINVVVNTSKVVNAVNQEPVLTKILGILNV